MWAELLGVSCPWLQETFLGILVALDIPFWQTKLMFSSKICSVCVKDTVWSMSEVFTIFNIVEL